MGFFDKLLHAIGFEDDESTQEKQVKPKKDKKSKEQINAKFDLKKFSKADISERKIGESSNENNDDDVQVFVPKTQEEIESVVTTLGNGENAIVNLVGFSEIDRTRALDFISGAVYLLKGRIQRLEKAIYLVEVK